MEAGAPELLVIDDDQDVGALVEHIAERAGYSPTSVSKFDEFKFHFDDDVALIVIDLMMPGVDGIEVLRYLAAQNCAAALVLISAVDQRVLQTAMQLAKAQGLWTIKSLTKPFPPAELETVLSQALPTVTNRRVRPAIEHTDVAPEVRHELSQMDLQRALDKDEIVVFYQPKINIVTRALGSLEALVRWEHPREGILEPGHFIPLAEQSGLIETVTERVMEKAFAQIAEWQNQGLRLYVAINVSASSLNRIDLPDRIAELVSVYNVAPEQIIIEVTESWLTDDAVTALDILTRMRLKGFGLAIDDFGTGYSTMEQLKEIPFSELKLDRAFVHGATDHNEARVIAGSSVSLGQELNLQVVAEGVETEEDWDLVSALGCDMAQGYFIAPPMRGGDFLEWLQRWREQHRLSDPPG
ncbi:MAG: EAL domain-containing response regulator [Gammaproteobacteria bacterium]|nr:EAL domain-containing response regulator [Gammaproteobacteria bacterium]